ncbi:conserved hypothetical protein [Anaeromyxobacter dehalogenans 2CP-1]|uniref:Uncharacterized protein n=1 Tax=Anaeromyxobacter dehalogenans (strain ATCC BAA-258 / DSM 21875 / 2CP-1) TaxID=455488 RepID=B8J9F8_ANAD2|nr:hypothetical protein [Anaeromyxobacter dehalogenans]ACL67346.1 conserved hypothetical protein [Anaeromyxobacter dehalogenans 2CP-1]
MQPYTLGVAGLLAMACDCIRRGDLDGAAAAIARARALHRPARATRRGAEEAGTR